MDRKILFFILVISLFLISCEESLVEQQKIEGANEVQEIEESLDKVCVDPNILVGGDCCLDDNNNKICDSHEEIEDKSSCKVTADCDQGLLCIDGQCGVIEELYETDCENKCSITSVTVFTSDEETYTLKLGQGSYSYAGALEWRLLSTPQYCKGGDPLVPIRVIKKSYGEVLNKQVLTLHKGETSDVITHPTVGSLEFTATLKEVVEECS